MESEYILEMKGICKSFTGIRVLQDVDFMVRPGEIHALVGENGAGKSTLIKILTGIYGKDAGDIIFDGNQIHPSSSLEAQKLGISSIYQELNLIPHLSIAENIFIGREPRKFGLIDWKKIMTDAKRILKEKLGLECDVSKNLNECPTAVVQMVALARVITLKSKLVIMDEATSSLEETEVKKLFGNIRKMKASGIAVIFITHKIDEIFQICDSVTVLKDGQMICNKSIQDITKLELISSMIGRDASEILLHKKKYRDYSNEPIVCKTIQIGNGPKLVSADVSVRRGEVVGLSGLLGSGRTELAKAIFGADVRDSGELYVKGHKVNFKMPLDAIRCGIGFCSEDRRAEGIMPYMTIQDNISMAILPQISQRGVIDKAKTIELTKKYIDILKIKTTSRMQLIRNLSGGNQQKVLLARWLCMSPDFIILDEPTRGIDVGAKAEIESIIQQLSDNGVGVLYISSEIEELIRGCDRIIVLKDGRTVAELIGEEISESNLLRAVVNEAPNTSESNQEGTQE